LKWIYSRLTQDPRVQGILRGSFTGLLSRGVTLLTSAITLPLTVRYLGAQEYGVWITISGSVAMLAVLDLGLASTLTNRIAEAGARGDEALGQRYYATAFWLTAAIALCLGLVLALVLPRVNWMYLFHLHDPQLALAAGQCVFIACISSLIALPLNLVTRVLGGYQQLHLANYFVMTNSILTLIAIGGGVLLRFSLVHLMLCYCVFTNLGLFALNLWFCFYRRPTLRPLPWKLRPRYARELFGEGTLFFVIQLCNIVVFNSDNLVITHYLGADKVTPYSVAWRLITYATLLQQLIMPAAWPALTDAYYRNDMDWLRATYRSITRKSIVAVTVFALAIGLFGRTLVHFWIGPAAVPDKSLMWLMAFWAVLVSVTSNQALLLTAVGKMRLETTVAVLAAVTNLALSIYLVQRLGAPGVIIATISSFLIIMVGPQEWEVRRVLAGLTASRPLRDAVSS
jgi:O-antigen/teichoic acid export membrane protein